MGRAEDVPKSFNAALSQKLAPYSFKEQHENLVSIFR